jgi:hypothetical protein
MYYAYRKPFSANYVQLSNGLDILEIPSALVAMINVGRYWTTAQPHISFFEINSRLYMDGLPLSATELFSSHEESMG